MKLVSLIALLFIVSCGTLRSPKNIIPLDSKPRGLDVYYNNEKVGTTPFFHEVNSNKNHRYAFRKNNKEINLTYKCSFNWDQSILPSSLLMLITPVGTIAGGIGLTTDFFTGGLYRCHEPLFLSTKLTVDLEERKEEKIIFLPVHNEDQLFSKVVLEKWLEKNPEYKGRVLFTEDVSDDLYERGITHSKDNDPRDITRYALSQVANKYKANHFFYFPYEESADGYLFTPKLIDAFNLKETKEFEPIEIVKPDKHKNPWLKTMGEIFKIIPNGFRVSMAINPTVNFDHESNGEDYTKNGSQTDKHPKSLPDFLSALRVENVNHPQEFNNWDFSGVIYPWVSATSWKSSNLGKDSNYDFWVIAYYLFVSGELTFHTPVGAFSGGVGYGYSYSEIEDSLGSSEDDYSAILNVNLHYVAFITHKFYFKLALDFFSPEKDEININGYKVKGWSEGSVGIGYYFPTFRKFFRELVRY